MSRLWIGCTADGARGELERALKQVSPSGRIVFARDAADIRCRLRDEEPGTVGAIVGLSESGVSDVNLAAALASDGRASEVVLVTRFVTGSLRSRAAQAGISRVVDIDDVIFDEMALGSASVPGAVPDGAETGSSVALGASHAPILTVASGRGGVGKTATCALMAALAGHWGMSVALCDLDLACGNLPSCVGVGRWPDASTYVAGGHLDARHAAAAGVSAAEGVGLWGPCALPELAERAMPASGELLAQLADTHDLVVVDTSTTCTDAVAQAMQLADRLVLVHDAGAGGVASLARASALAVRLGVARTRVVRVENGCAPRQVGAPLMPSAEVGLEAARAFRVPDGGDEVRDLLAAGRVEELRELGGPFVEGVAAVTAALLSELGCLPDCEAARRVAEGPRQRRARALFRRQREVA